MKKSEKSGLKFKSLKSKLSENNGLTKAISVIFLILIMFGLFTFIIVGLYQFNLIPFPILNIFFNPADSNITDGGDAGNIYDWLRNNGGPGDLTGGGYYFEDTLDNIKAVIANIRMPDNLYLETEAKYYADGKAARTEEMSLWKKGEKYKYILKVNSRPEESYINDAVNEFIENFQTDSKRTRPVSAAFSFDNVPHIKNINYYLNLLESGEIKSHIIYRYPDSNIVRIKYIIPQLDQTELIDISLDTGIVKSVICRVGKNGDKFYECETKVIEAYYDGDGQSASKSSIRDSLFAINSR